MKIKLRAIKGTYSHFQVLFDFNYLILLKILAFLSVSFEWFKKTTWISELALKRAGVLQQVLEMVSLCLYTCS